VTATGDGLLDEVDLWPITLGPSPGWRTPSAAPNILFPGSPILGGLPTLSKPSIAGPPIARIAGSEGGASSGFGELNVEEMSAFSVGWEGKVGRVGEGSRSLGWIFARFWRAGGCSGMDAVPFNPGRTPFRKELELLMVEAERPCEMDPLELWALEPELI